MLVADINVEVIFFLVAAVIALINKLYEKSKQLRERAIKQQHQRETRDRLDLVRAGAEVVEAPPLEEKPRAAIAVRPAREPRVRPPRRTRRVTTVVPSAPPKVEHAPRMDTSFVRRLRRDPKALKEAIILREVLGPPVAYRGFRFPRR